MAEPRCSRCKLTEPDVEFDRPTSMFCLTCWPLILADNDRRSWTRLYDEGRRR